MNGITAAKWRQDVELRRQYLARFRDHNPEEVDKVFADMDPDKITDEEHEREEVLLSSEYRRRAL